MVFPTTSCRLCFVEVEGKDIPVTACSLSSKDGMIIRLDTPKVKRIRSASFELLLSHHNIDCAHCDKNKKCELQDITVKLGKKLKLQRFHKIPRNLPIDYSHPSFYYDPNKCILCGKCIYICQQQGVGSIDFAFRGLNTVISTFTGIPLVQSKCNSCLECVKVCPVGSLVIKPSISLKRSPLVH